MSTELITQNIWQRLTQAVKKTKTKSIVAVAYFGKGGATMLPLAKGSTLLVDASEKAVKSGQTCPAELIKLYNRGVLIYSLQDLHAKLFIVGNALYIGSTNVSGRSSTLLTEILIKITDKNSIFDAKQFISNLCKVELGSELLSELNAKYRPPHIPGGKIAGKRNSSNSTKPSFCIYHLNASGFDEDEQEQSKIGSKEAGKNRINKSRHYVDEFVWRGDFKPKKMDIVMQILDEGDKVYVSPPGIIIHQRKWKSGNKNKTICFVECPDNRRKEITKFKKRLTKQETKQLNRNGKASKALTEKIFSLWNLR